MPRRDRTAHDGVHTLSAAQQRQWVADQLVTDPPDHVVLRWRIHGPLDTTALRSAMTALVERHPALRTRLTANEAVPRRTTSADPAYDLSLLPGPAAGVPRGPSTQCCGRRST